MKTQPLVQRFRCKHTLINAFHGDEVQPVTWVIKTLTSCRLIVVGGLSELIPAAFGSVSQNNEVAGGDGSAASEVGGVVGLDRRSVAPVTQIGEVRQQSERKTGGVEVWRDV